MNNVTNYNVFEKQSKNSSVAALAPTKPQFTSVSSSMRRYRRNNYRWVADKPEENTLDLDNTQNSKANELDKSNWNIPVQESKLGDKKELPKDKPVISLESREDSIDSKKINCLKEINKELSKRQRFSVENDLQEIFDEKKQQELVAKAIDRQAKHFNDYVKLIERKVQNSMESQFHKMWERALR